MWSTVFLKRTSLGKIVLRQRKVKESLYYAVTQEPDPAPGRYCHACIGEWRENMERRAWSMEVKAERGEMRGIEKK